MSHRPVVLCASIVMSALSIGLIFMYNHFSWKSGMLGLEAIVF